MTPHDANRPSIRRVFSLERRVEQAETILEALLDSEHAEITRDTGKDIQEVLGLLSGARSIMKGDRQ